MSQPCAIQDCKRASRALCHCCNQNLCRDHFNKHDDLLNSQLNPLTDEINTLADRLTAINVDRITNDSRQKLNQWRIDCHKKIDEFYEEKCKELDRYVNESVNQQRKAITNLRSKMSELIEKQETTKHDIDFLTSGIRTLDQQMNEIGKFQVQIDIRPLMIDSHLVHIRRSEIREFDLSNLPVPHQTIGRIRCDNVVTSNDRFLLVHINENICLIDENLSIVKMSKWNKGSIADMCWSPTLARFITTTKKDILLIDENSCIPERIQAVEGNCWLSCECSNKSLYLSRNAWDSSILEYTLLPSIQFIKIWKTTHNLKSEQRVDAIKYNNETLALVINDRSSRAKFMDLRSSKTFILLRLIQFDVSYNDNIIRCCSLDVNGWLLSDWFTSRLFHVTHEGKLEKTDIYEPAPNGMALFGSNTLVILANDSVNFHQL
jgi:hypothetical protein